MSEPVREQEAQHQEQHVPIHETADTVSYLGARLPKAQNRDGIFVPDRDRFKDFINDRFSLDLQKQIAIGLHQGHPILVEGGTSIGKTTTARKMAAELGYEVHYANLNFGTDETKLMGKPMPNQNRISPEDPEYVYWLGKVAAGLVPEDGKIKMIVIDELGAATPGNLIVMHEILDAVERGEPIDLSEYGNGVIYPDPKRTKIVALTNPPGRGYLDRSPLDPALIRRFAYIKAPSELPIETFNYSTQALFGMAPQLETPTPDKYITTRPEAMLPENLAEIPGISEMLVKYQEFHQGAKKFVKERKIGTNQPQPFTFDDRVEPRRVRDFILSFYTGDINATFKQALRYYYSNKLESPEDKAKLEELIALVEYGETTQASQRRSLPSSAPESTSTPAATPTGTEPETTTGILTPLEGVTILETDDLMSNERRVWSELLGRTIEPNPLPAHITPEVRKNLESMGLRVMYVPHMDLGTKDDIKPLTTRRTLGMGSKEEVKSAAENYLTQLQEKYPKWKRYEGMSAAEKANHKVARNFQEWYWDNVKDGNIDFPELPGKWIAVEVMPKPKYGKKYAKVPLTDAMSLEDRFSVSWDDADTAIEGIEDHIARQAGISGHSHHARMLTSLEWNLIANREGWGATDTWEWTQDEYRGSGESLRLLVGDSGYGGAARVGWNPPGRSHGALGFRVAVTL